ncbi:MAG: hypothetical protein ACYDBJ_28135 [Aggregatilineales bacterium]
MLTEYTAEASYQVTLTMSDMLRQKQLPAQQILIPPKLVIRESTKEVI